ncbi:PP2C family protein-serine/threonine phosphatase [Mycoplasma phocoenae]|uniref:Serine/threonine-protein phosphatase n=1 Tax=Mycoplasma phocoenae TaxID=754517 RepID=A0A858U6J5_9MOLU|nr:protein phosphatase 2C domain-containing protein [Mycoplasma phocoenae]QJG66885.1 serine/threonine-protein phosphatase [Mycoplasma phocoenae]
MPLQIRFSSNIGSVRNENQDYAGYYQKQNLILGVVCDGMGGHNNGSIASKTAVETLIEHFKTTDIETYKSTDKKLIQNWFNEGIYKIDKKMKELVLEDENNADMGTTLITFLYFIEEEETYVFNIGDSRAYLYNGFLHQISQDQNVMNYFINEENMNPETAGKIIGWDRLTSSLGPNKTKNIDTFVIHKDSKIKKLILTTDGLHTFVPKPIFEYILQQKNTSLAEKIELLLQKAIELKSNDNLTCLIMEVE